MAKSTSSFSELAQMYFPGCATPKNAVRCLQRSIKRCTKLATLLAETGYLPYNHRRSYQKIPPQTTSGI